MKVFTFLLFFLPKISIACLENEAYIKEQWIESYTRNDGTFVTGHNRVSHCRMINNYTFEDHSKKNFKGIKTKFKKWKQNEKEAITNLIKNLPSWLLRYKITEVLRASHQEGNPNNPAAIHPATRELIIFDKFFKSNDKPSILIHELAHVAVLNIDEENYPLLIDFFKSNGWTYKIGSAPIPPKQVIIEDSVDSPSEDFANSVEMYYTAPEKLKKFNINSFIMLEKIIQSKTEKKQ